MNVEKRNSRSGTSRRRFLTASTLAGASLATSLVSGGEYESGKIGNLQGLVHVAYFWLKNPGSEEDRQTLIDGIKQLAQIPSVKTLHVGIPATTEKRDVVDNSFQVAEIMLFDSVEDQKTYQDHPLHQQFVEQHAHLWDRVVVHDSVSA
ncbi:Dabb family protein [Pseudomaricurvus sp.]|uniref:Dabb family protein n=1 Tax=Pseudomaricurvus sp. TaxID=2004510 RepID=UPI003F6BD5A8